MRPTDRALIVVLGIVTTTSAALGVGSTAVAFAPEPPLVATPEAECGPGSRPETGLQGRVSPEDHTSGKAAEGSTCNTELVGSFIEESGQGTYGGYKVERYVDAAGHECAFFDSTLLFPTDLDDGRGGVQVLDMADPANPVLTATLVTPAMLSPHESLVLSKERGILAAVFGNPGANVGIVDVYDVSGDCRQPELLSSSPVGLVGHESGMAPDGRTFYSASPGTSTVQAVALENLPAMTPVWTSVGEYPSHGLSVSDDGNRIYVAGLDGLIILDTTEVQARTPMPEVREVARLTWDTMSIPQNAIPITVGGHPYLVEIDEFGAQSKVGAGRIIDIADETQPRVVSNLRLEVHQPEHFAETAEDNGATNPIQGYSGHYCSVPRRDDPGIVACSMILSGLRVFDIRDPHQPKEIAYFNAPIRPRSIMEPSNYAMSSPSFVPERNEVWYTDGYSGFYNVRLTNGAWPAATASEPAVAGGDPVAPAEEVATRSAHVAGSALPATGGETSSAFVLVSVASGALLLVVLRRARRHPA